MTMHFALFRVEPYLGTLRKVFGRHKRELPVQSPPATAETMAPTNEYVAVVERIQKQLFASFLAPGAPGVGGSDALMEQIKTESAKYKEILDQKKGDWSSIEQRLRNIFDWGVALGQLIELADNEPKEAMRVREKITALRDELFNYYESKKKTLAPQDIKERFEDIRRESEEVIKAIFHLHIRLDKDSQADFESLYGKFNSNKNIRDLPDAWAKIDVVLEEVKDTFTFYAYHLSIFVMFRNGLQQALNPQEKRETVRDTELLQLTMDVGEAFRRLEEIINQMKQK